MLNGVMEKSDVWEREEGRWRLRVGWKGEGKSVRRESKPAIKRRVSLLSSRLDAPRRRGVFLDNQL